MCVNTKVHFDKSLFCIRDKIAQVVSVFLIIFSIQVIFFVITTLRISEYRIWETSIIGFIFSYIE